MIGYRVEQVALCFHSERFVQLKDLSESWPTLVVGVSDSVVTTQGSEITRCDVNALCKTQQW